MKAAIEVLIAFLASVNQWVPTEHIDRREVYCLASTVYGEARGDGRASQIHVASVVLRRSVRSGRSICDVVRRPKQFAGFGKPIDDLAAWRTSVEVAVFAMSGVLVDLSQGATHFWDYRRVDPEWSRKLVIIGDAGSHRFAREP